MRNFSLTNLFEPKPPVAAPVVQPNTQQQQPNTGSVQIDGAANNQQKNNATGDNKGGSESSPLDPFKDFWDTPKVEDGTGNNPTGNQPTNSNPKQQPAANQVDFTKIAKGIDFSRVLNRDIVAKALSGDVDSFMAVINSTAQAATAASMRAAHQMNTKSSSDTRASILESLPGEFRKHSLLDTKSPNAALNHPAMRPLIDSVRVQMATKYPDATTEELQEKAEQYVTTVFGEVSKGAVKGNKRGNASNDDGDSRNDNTHYVDTRGKQIQDQMAGEFNWDEYLNPQTQEAPQL